MPLIEICALPQADDVDVPLVLQAVTDAVSEAIPCRREAVWVTWRPLDGYAVGDSIADAQPAETHAPVVHVYANRPANAVERTCNAIEAVLARELSLADGNVFITVQPVFALPDQQA